MKRNIPSSRASTVVSRLLIAFESTEYRWLWASSFFSSMTLVTGQLAQGWLVLRITDSPLWVGLVAGIQGLGLVSFGAFGGTLVDRLDARKVLALAYLINASLVLALGVLELSGNIALWHLLVAAVFQGGCNAVQLPALNTMIYRIAGPQRLLNAIAARMMAMNLSRLVGSLAAGGLIAKFGVGSCYLYAGSSTYVAVALLLLVKGTFRDPSNREPFWHSMGQGLKYVWSNKPIRMLLLLSLAMEAFGFSHFVMIPVMARDVLHVGPSGLGYLSAASGFGAMVSTIIIASLGDYKHKGALLVATAGAAGLSLVFFALSPWFLVSLVAVTMVGGSLMAYDVSIGTVFQLLNPDAVRGRVLGLYGLTFGFTPVGGFLAGAIAFAVSAPFALSIFGVLIVANILRISRPVIRLRPTRDSIDGVI